jgi:hypothetical protein
MYQESWADHIIRQARERGEFEALPGYGKPLKDIDVDDALWWVKALIQRENIEVPLPPTLAVRKARDDALAQIAQAHDEAVVRAVVEELNAAIRDVNRKATEGPPSSVMVLDVEEVVASWARQRAAG